VTRNLDAEIDHLYQLPLDEFTGARNALAKDLGGSAAREIKSLPKPSLPAWAVNQLYWQARPTYNALIQAAERLRAAHRAVLEGNKADITRADVAHRAAIREALNRAATMLGSAASPATREAMTRTLEALPAQIKPGRLTQALLPAGFAILEGLIPRQLPVPKPSSSSRVQPAWHESRLAFANARKRLAAAERELVRARDTQANLDATVKREAARLAALHADEARQREVLDRVTASRQALERDVERLRFEARTAATAVVEAERELAKTQMALDALRSNTT